MANISDNMSFNVWDYLDQKLGPQILPLELIIPITILYSMIFVSGCIGNTIVCTVISRNSHFQTPTDYYLFSLAVSDLLILVFGLPNDLKAYWQQYPWGLGEAICKLRAFISEMTSYVSVLTIVAFTIERYIAICHPLFIQTVSTLPRAIKFITSVWIISCICALPFAYYMQVEYLEYPDKSGHILESGVCILPNDIQHITRPLLQSATFVFFLLPLTVIFILYIKISIKLRSTKFARMTYTSSSRCSSVISTYSPETRKTTVRRSVNKMLIAVVIAFFICWAPFHAQRLLVVFISPQDWTESLKTLNEYLYYATGCFYYFSATINPILYTSMSSKYRGAFLNILTCSKSRKASNASLFRTTGNACSDTGHSEKSHSLRISKQSFDADSSLLNGRLKKYNYSDSKNHLCIPDKKTGDYIANDEHYRSKGDVNSMSFVKISPEGRLDDVLEHDRSSSPEQNSICSNSVKSENCILSSVPKKNLILIRSKKHRSVDNLLEFKNCILVGNNLPEHAFTKESQV